MAGHYNLFAVINRLLTNSTFGLESARTFILTGCSAGGISVFSNADWVQSLLSPRTKLLAVPQAGYFFPQNIATFEEWVVGSLLPINKPWSEYVVALEDSFLHPRCVETRKKDGGLLAECWDANVALNYSRVPFFVAENMWDQLMIEDLLFMPPLNDSDTTGFINYYGERMRSSLMETLKPTDGHGSLGNPDFFTGLFLPSCFSHTHSLCMAANTAVGNVTFKSAVTEWVASGGTKKVIVMSDCYKYGTCSNPCANYCG